ncbi:MAG: dienelactone hydrolase family protein [Gammaproteobacteria bacterium]|nr:dienelactone hydrolase family protein [Gammaproteobacteria bacterium]
MCDEQTEKDIDDLLDSESNLTRRDFGRLSAALGITAILPRVVNAMEVIEQDVKVTTADGVADCYFVHPTTGTHAAVLVWPDILGLRPAFRSMGKRLAESGYSVLVVNPYYRNEPSPVVEVGASFRQPETRAKVLPLARTLNAQTHFSDAKAFIAFLDQQDSVDTSRKIGTTGYCMGGPIVMRTAAAVPDRIGAIASFHGGGLATEAEDSPHLLIPNTRAQVLHAIAENDDEKNPEAKNILREAYAAAGIPAEIEVYKGTLHGWCPPDSVVYNEVQAERAWNRLLNLFQTALV